MGQNTLNNTKYTPERVDKILSLLKEGRHITHACALSGIHIKTLYNWIEYDEKGDERFQGFADLVREAKAIGETVLEDKVMGLCDKGKNPDARTAFEMLKTKNRDVYANVDKVELSGTIQLNRMDIIKAIDEAENESGGATE